MLPVKVLLSPSDPGGQLDDREILINLSTCTLALYVISHLVPNSSGRVRMRCPLS